MILLRRARQESAERRPKPGSRVAPSAALARRSTSRVLLLPGVREQRGAAEVPALFTEGDIRQRVFNLSRRCGHVAPSEAQLGSRCDERSNTLESSAIEYFAAPTPPHSEIIVSTGTIVTRGPEPRFTREHLVSTLRRRCSEPTFGSQQNRHTLLDRLRQSALF